MYYHWWEEAYEEVDGVGNGGYDWEEFKILRKKETGDLFVAYASGCSCTSWAEEVSEEDLIPVKNWQEAVEVAKTHISDRYGDITEADVFEMAERLARS